MTKTQLNEQSLDSGETAAISEEIKEGGQLEAGNHPLSELGLSPDSTEADAFHQFNEQGGQKEDANSLSGALIPETGASTTEREFSLTEFAESAPSLLEPEDPMGGILDDSLPSTPSPPSPGEIHRENAERVLTNAMIAKCLREIWEPRLEREIHFEEFESFYEGDFHILFFRGQILVLSDDVARAVTLVDALGPDAEYSAAEIIDIVNVCDLIVVPGPGVVADFVAGDGGTYVPLEVLVSMLWDSDCEFEEYALSFHGLLEEFEEQKLWQQEWRLRNARLRKLRLQALPRLEAELRSRKRKL